MPSHRTLATARRLFETHRVGLMRHVARLTADPDDAEDVVQEVYLRFLERPPESDRNLPAWLHRVATNLVRDRARARHREAIADRDVETLSADGDTSSAAERSDARRQLTVLLRPLNARERTVLLMRAEGFTHREIAQAVGATTRSVGTMIARALRKVIGGLRGHGESGP